jgi:hypothetical protein
MKKKPQSVNFSEYSPLFKLVKRWVEEEGKHEERTLEKLFVKFLNSLPSFYFQNNKTVPFSVAKIALTNFRINEVDAKSFLKEFARLGLIEVVKFRGYKLNITKIVKLLQQRHIIKFCEDCKIDRERLLNALRIWMK